MAVLAIEAQRWQIFSLRDERIHESRKQEVIQGISINSLKLEEQALCYLRVDDTRISEGMAPALDIYSYLAAEDGFTEDEFEMVMHVKLSVAIH